MLECLALIVISKQTIISPKHSQLAEQVPLNLILNPKPKPPVLNSLSIWSVIATKK